MPIDEKLKEPNWLLFNQIEKVRKMMHHSVLKMRHENPTLYEKIKFPTDEQVIDHIRQWEDKRSGIHAERDERVDLREQANKEILSRKGGLANLAETVDPEDWNLGRVEDKH
eukprot:sb/3477053/